MKIKDELPEGNIITVGAERFRCAEVFLFFSAMLQCRVARWHDRDPRVFFVTAPTLFLSCITVKKGASSFVHSASRAGTRTCAITSVERRASVATVTEEGAAARTINLCKQCHYVRRLKQGERQVMASKWREMVEQEASRGKLWHGTIRTQNVETFHHQKKRGPDQFWQMRKRKGKTEQTADGNDSRHIKEKCELVRHSSDLRFEGILMLRACHAEKLGDWENYLGEFPKDDRLSVRASVKVGECHSAVELEDDGRVCCRRHLFGEREEFRFGEVVTPPPSPSLPKLETSLGFGFAPSPSSNLKKTKNEKKKKRNMMKKHKYKSIKNSEKYKNQKKN